MFLLAISVAIFDEHARLTCLETDNPHHLLLAAISAVADCRHIIPVVTPIIWRRRIRTMLWAGTLFLS
jgi:hypothetical protein